MWKKRDTEMNRAEAVTRYEEKQLLQKIEALEELDQKNQLSDRRMLVEAYRDYGRFASRVNPALAEKYYYLALGVLLEMFERGQLQEENLEELVSAVDSLYMLVLSGEIRGEGIKEYLEQICARIKELEEDAEAASYIDPLDHMDEIYECDDAIFERRPRQKEAVEEVTEGEMEEYVVSLRVEGLEKRRAARRIISTCRILRFEEGIEVVEGVEKQSKLQKLILPSSVKEIGILSFANSSSLEEAHIPSGLIGRDAFKGCGKLKSVFLGADVRLNGNPFQECPNLETISISSENTVYEIKNGVVVETAAARVVCVPAKRVAGKYKVDVGIREIGDFAFCSSEDLQELEIQGRLEAIGSSAFANCKDLIQIKGLDVSGEIGDYAFEGCTSLKEIELYADALGHHAFSRCTALEEARFDVRSLGWETFDKCKTLSKVYLGDRLRQMGRTPFRRCPNLQMVRLPGELEWYFDQLPYKRQTSLILQVQHGSRAEAYAKLYNYPYIYEGEETIRRIGDEVTDADREAFLTRRFRDFCLDDSFVEILEGAGFQTPADVLVYPSRELEAMLEMPDIPGELVVEELGNIFDTMSLSIRETRYDINSIVKQGWRLYETYMGNRN